MCRYQLQKSKSESFRTLHRALSEAEFSLLTHTQTKELYAMPSSLSPLAKSLYRIAGLKPSTAPHFLVQLCNKPSVNQAHFG